MKLSTFSSYFRSSVLAGLVAVASVAPGYHAVAQTPTMREVADIPFDFRSGTNVMPAGRYVISKLSDHVILLRGETSGRTQAICTFDTSSLKTQDSGRVVFHKYGSQYFLYQVWTAGQNGGVQLPKGHAEKEMLRAKADLAPTTMELALNQEPLH